MKVIIVLFGFALGVAFFQGCTSGFGVVSRTFGSLSSASHSHPVTVSIDSHFSFSADYQGPSAKQGVSEARTSMSSSEFDARYAVLHQNGVGYRQYNVWWSQLEPNPGVPSSATPIACPAGLQLVPANESERVALGYHRYRCLDPAFIATFDNLFRRDQANGILSGIVMWSSAVAYRNAGCEGFGFGGNLLKDGCVPRDNAMDDFEDYANFLASRYNGGANGKISHFIVWNENASDQWFDITPIVAHGDESQAGVAIRLDKYADMMKRVHAALSRHQHGALMFASTDQLWEPNQVAGHMGTRVLLEGLWARLGTNYSWSVAVHPYGNVENQAPSRIYTFNNLEMVESFQIQHLQAAGVQNPNAYPQSLMIASEQGWPMSTDHGREGQARQICLAHQKVMTMPYLTAVGHNYFHSVEPAETDPNGTSGQGAFFGLIPYSVPNSLAGFEATSTGQAFLSTWNPALWNQRADHYCCRVYGLGCPGNDGHLSAPSVVDSHQVMGHVDSVAIENGVAVIHGWACTRAMEPSGQVHLYIGLANGGQQFLTAWAANEPSEPQVAATCATSGAQGYRFSISLDTATRQNYGGSSIYIYGISSIGGANNLLDGSAVYQIPALDPNTPAPTSTPAPAPRPNSTAGSLVPIYRFYKASTGEHFLTTSQQEGQANGFAFEGVAFSLLANPASGAHPLYRCYDGQKHFVSTASNCEGMTSEGVLGYATDAAGSSTPNLIRRYYLPQNGDHLATENLAEGPLAGYSLEGDLGYGF